MNPSIAHENPRDIIHHTLSDLGMALKIGQEARVTFDNRPQVGRETIIPDVDDQAGT